MKETWKRLSYEDLAQVLACDEIEKLNDMSISADISAICQDQLDSVADAYRASFMGKGYECDQRSHYLPNGYKMYALALARYFICTRFPNSNNIFLDEPRKKLFEKAQELLEDPILGVPEPDYSDVPELSALGEREDAAITLPFQRIISRPGRYGFWHPYAADYAGLSCIF